MTSSIKQDIKKLIKNNEDLLKTNPDLALFFNLVYLKRMLIELEEEGKWPI